jgi:hypothetical protein
LAKFYDSSGECVTARDDLRGTINRHRHLIEEHVDATGPPPRRR